MNNPVWSDLLSRACNPITILPATFLLSLPLNMMMTTASTTRTSPASTAEAPIERVEFQILTSQCLPSHVASRRMLVMNQLDHPTIEFGSTSALWTPSFVRVSKPYDPFPPNHPVVKALSKLRTPRSTPRRIAHPSGAVPASAFTATITST
jgi:hypothetical protein